ncbi:MAG: glutamate--cysteine ligase [Marmoricola sp.]|nr:glutamate--cysteine ligase [Marmoricola sp.]
MVTDTLLRGVSDLFATRRRPTRRVAVEQELITRDAVDGSVVLIGRVRRATRGASYAASLGFEPGGQVELSLPCSPSIAELERQVHASLRGLCSDCAEAGVLLDADPVDQSGREVPLQLVSPRYVEMQRHFDRIGPDGRRMMRLTASTQICLDWWPGRAGLEQWRLAQLAGPFVAALFARAHGPGSRLATWLAVDPGRTAFDDRLLGGDPVRRYCEFAATAQAFALPEDPRAAVTHHLSTLFPPVRPRGSYLELRCFDAQPEGRVSVAAALLATLLYDDESRQGAVRLLAGEGPHLKSHWHTAAMAPSELAAQGHELVDLALDGFSRAPRGYLPGDAAARLRELVATPALVGAA